MTLVKQTCKLVVPGLIQHVNMYHYLKKNNLPTMTNTIKFNTDTRKYFKNNLYHFKFYLNQSRIRYRI